MTVGHSAIETAEKFWEQAVQAYSLNNKGRAYWWLGRIAHLMGDMSVPAHVHLDKHGSCADDWLGCGGQLLFGEDSYEEWMRYSSFDQHTECSYGSGIACNFERFTINFPIQLTSLDITPYDTITNYDPLSLGQYSSSQRTYLFNLFYDMAEIADYYESDASSGDSNESGYHAVFHSCLFSLPCLSVQDSELLNHANVLMPEAIRHIAGLYQLFWDTTHPPTITSTLTISPQQSPYAVGQTVSSQFTITNKGGTPITVAKLTVGGRDPDGLVADFPEKTCVTLQPNIPYKYEGTMTLAKAGTYHFFPAYETPTTNPQCPAPDGNWNTAIPSESGITQYTLDSPLNITVVVDTAFPTVNLTAPANGSTVSGTVTVTANALDNLSISKVEFYLDNILKFTDSLSPYSWSWDTTGVSNGSHILYAKAYDGAGNTGTSSTITVTVNNPTTDTTPPTISSVSSSTTNTTATVTWITNEPANSQLEYGTSPCPCTNASPFDATLVTNHSITLTGLASSATYYYRVYSRDAAGNLAYSSNNSFTTGTSGNVAPSATVGKPNGGEIWAAGSVQTITWAATDSNGVASVSLFYSIDSGLNWTAIPGATSISNSGSFPWTVPSISSTTVRVAVTATDGQMTGSDTSDGNFTISASCTSPSIPQLWGIGTLSETGNYTVSWSSVTGATSYTLQEATNSSFTTPIEYSNLTDLSKSISGKTTNVYYYRVKANNSCGSSGWSNIEYIQVTINQPPTVPSNPSPADSSTNISRRPTLSWLSGDPDGTVDFAVYFGADLANLTAIRGYNSGTTSSSYVFTYDLNPGTTYYWYIKAKDNKGVETVGPTWRFTTADAYADLVPTNLTVTGTIAPNAQVTLNLTIQNQGTYTAPGAQVFFYYSLISGGKEQKLQNTGTIIPQLDPGAQTTITQLVTLTNLKAGQSYIDAWVDTQNYFIEGNLNNNTLSSPINYQDGNPPVISYLVLQGTLFRTGGQYPIVFTVSDDIGVSTLDFYYSIDNGLSWNLIIAGFVPGSNGFSNGYYWTIPSDAPLTSQLKVKMVARDASANSAEATAGPYTIVSGTAPTVAIISPNGGEVWDLGSTQAITWSVNAPNGISAMNLYLYYGDRVDWIANITTNTTGRYSWVIPNSANYVTDNTKIKISVEDLNRNMSEDISDAPFTIHDPSAPPPPPWTTPEVVTGQPPDSSVDHSTPRIATDKNDNVHLVYMSSGKLYYKKKTGTTWLSESLFYDPNPSNKAINSYEIMVDFNGSPHVVWSEQPAGGVFTNINLSDIYHTYYNGSSWSAPVNISSTSTPSDFTWSSKTSLPEAKSNAASGVVNGKIYVFGGDFRISNYEYDPATNTWTRKTDVPGNGIGEGGAAVINNKIYAIGDPFDNVIKIYDPSTNIWTTGNAIPTPRRLMGVGAANGKLYTFGGDGNLNEFSTTEEYDPSTNTWTSKASMPTPRYSPSVAVINNLIYVVGGSTRNSSPYLGTNEVYDPTSNTWTVKTSMPTARRGAVAEVINGRIYVAGGAGGSGYLNTVEEYDPASDVWVSKTPIPTSRADAVSGTINDKMYVIGGRNGAGSLSTVEEGVLSGQGGSQTVSTSPNITTDSFSNLYVVWVDGYSYNSDLTQNGTANIYYRKRDNSGNWSSITQLTNNYGAQPAITSDSIGNIHVVYQSSPDGISVEQISYLKWDGSAWIGPQAVADINDYLLDVESDTNNALHLVWYNNLYSGGQRILYSSYNGTSWSALEEVQDSDSSTGYFPFRPSLVVDSSNRPHVIWEVSGTRQAINYKFKDAQSWSQAIQLNLDSQYPEQYSSNAAISTTDQMHVVWTSYYNGHQEVIYNHANVSLDTTPPNISLNTPTFGEALSIGASYPITWVATDNVGVAGISLKYTTDNGLAFTDIITGIANSGTYGWTVPNITAGTVQIFATASDAGGNQATAVSGIFSISDQTAPTVSILSPNGGEVFEAGSTQTITWTATDNVAVSSVDLYYSLDGGLSWISIVTGQGNTGAYSWTVPYNVSASCLIKIVAYDEGGRIANDTSNGSFAIISANNPPLAPYGPTPLNGEAGVSLQPTLNWSSSDPDVGDLLTYAIYFGANIDPPLVSTGQQAATYIPGPLSAMATYYWKIVASDGKTSTIGPVWSFTTGPEPVSAPTNLNATSISPNQVDLSWADNAGNETGYKIERKIGLNGSYIEIATSAANATVYSNQGLTGNTTYIYRVKAYNTLTVSGYSNEASATTGNNAPNIPFSPFPSDNASGQPVNLTLSWSGGDPDPSDTVTYDIYFGTSNDPPLVSVGQSLASYNPGTLTYQKFYYWRVIATDNHGHSSSGPVWSFVTESEPAPNAPTGLSGSIVLPSQIDLTWTDNSNNEAGFKIERKIGIDGTYSQITAVPANTTSYSDTGLTPGQTYFYRVKAYNGSGSSTYSNEVSLSLPQIGLKGEYFDNADLTSPLLTRTDPNINFDWITGSPDATIAPDTFSVRWTGKIKIDNNETYTFEVVSDDGVRLWIDGYLLIDYWQTGGVSMFNTMALTQGLHDIKMEFFEDTGDAFAMLFWSSNSTPTSIIPQDHLYLSDSSGTAPLLAWTGEASYVSDGLEPQTGGTTTSFTYRVTYTDADGDAPMAGYPKVHILKGGQEITGSPFSMSYVIGAYATGAIYSYTALLSEGTDYSYYFDAEDQTGLQAVSSPTVPTPTAPLDAPDVINNYTLTIARSGTGSGTITSSQAGINCGSDCSEVYSSGQSVTLTAVPDASSTFTGWSGGGCSGTGTCVVTMNADTVATATFSLNQIQYTLTVSKSGTSSGIVTSNPAGINCGTDCSEVYTNAQSVILTATPDTSSTFAGWSGDADCSDGSVTMNASKTCTATFNPVSNPDFTLSPIGTSITLQAGSSGTKDFTVSSINGFNSAVTLTLSGQPAGVTGSFNPNPITPQANSQALSTLTINVGSSVSCSSYDLTVTATGGGKTHTSVLTLDVTGCGGLRGEYYNNADLTGLSLTRTDVNIKFDWAATSPDTTIEPDTFSVRWTGRIKIDTNETYTFTAITDDGIRLWIDGYLVIDYWQTGGASNSSSVPLTAGLHDIKIEFFENTGDSFIQLYWTSPSVPNAIIPQDHLSPPESSGNAPVLTWTGETGYKSDGLEPQIGNTMAVFNFSTRYTDSDGDAPMSGYPRVHILKRGVEISGSPFSMSYVSGAYTTGAIYSYTASLSEGTDYTHYFDAKDQTGLQAVASPNIPTPTVFFNAPDVTSAAGVSMDLDGSGRIDGFDLGRIGMAFGSKPGDTNWNSDADLNGDGLIDGSDLTLFGQDFGSMK